MNGQDQKAGEARVQALLHDALYRAGLLRPSGMTLVQFDALRADLCARLAYMTDDQLNALAEVCVANPGGPGRDRYPSADWIRTQAAQIAPPPDTGSPLLRRLFAHDTGARALAGGYAVELLVRVRKTRRWPGPYEVSQVQREAEARHAAFQRQRAAVAAGDDLSDLDQRQHDGRLRMIAKCEELRALGLADAAGGVVEQGDAA